tara:strand:- start:2053 stop:2397 length:345 start_codon:yes stop_codon:yes gene_type:complete
MTTTGGNTGNYYYGARYYDPKISVWLSVDPLSSRDPSLLPYHFVKNNPLMLVDPNGMTWDPAVKDKAVELKGFIENTKTDLEESNQKKQAKIDEYKSKNWSDAKKENRRKTKRN